MAIMSTLEVCPLQAVDTSLTGQRWVQAAPLPSPQSSAILLTLLLLTPSLVRSLFKLGKRRLMRWKIAQMDREISELQAEYAKCQEECSDAKRQLKELEDRNREMDEIWTPHFLAWGDACDAVARIFQDSQQGDVFVRDVSQRKQAMVDLSEAIGTLQGFGLFLETRCVGRWFDAERIATSKQNTEDMKKIALRMYRNMQQGKAPR